MLHSTQQKGHTTMLVINSYSLRHRVLRVPILLLPLLHSMPGTCWGGKASHCSSIIFLSHIPQIFSSNLSSKYPLQSHCYLPWNEILLPNLYQDISIFPLGTLPFWKLVYVSILFR